MENKVLEAAITGAKNGNREDFVVLCTEKGRAILYLCYRELKNWQDAEDAAQEVMLRMYRKLNKLESAEAFNVWLYRIVLSVCRDMHRKNKRHKNMVDMDDIRETLADESVVALPQTFLENDDMRERVVGYVDQLPEKYRQCILLHYYENLSYREIATVMGIRSVTVDSYLRMGRKLLRAKLEAEAQNLDGGKPYSLSSFAVGPLLAEVLHRSAEQIVPESMVEACVQSAEAGIALSAHAAAKMVTAGKLALAGAGAAMVFAAVVFLTPYLQQPVPNGAGTAGPSSLPQGSVVASVPSAPGGTKGGSTAAYTVTGTLEGRVFVETPGPDGNPIRRGVSGVVLQLVSAANPEKTLLEATTGPDGTFHFAGIEAADYRVLALLPEGVTAVAGAAWQPQTPKSGWLVQGGTADITVEGDASTSTLELQLALPVRLSGKVETPTPEGCEVLLIAPGGEVIASTFAGADGTFVFDDFYLPCEGEYTLRTSDNSLVLESVVYLYPGYGLGYVEGP